MADDAARRRLRHMGAALVVLAGVAATSGMIGVGGLLVLAFHRDGWSRGGLFFALLGVALAALAACVPLYRARLRLVESLGFEDAQ